MLEYIKSISIKAFNPSKFDFNPYDLLNWLYNSKSFKLYCGEGLGSAVLLMTTGVPNWSTEDLVEEDAQEDGGEEDAEEEQWTNQKWQP